jgi:hypothetical protein
VGSRTSLKPWLAVCVVVAVWNRTAVPQLSSHRTDWSPDCAVEQWQEVATGAVRFAQVIDR